MIFLIVALTFASQASAVTLNCNFTVDDFGSYDCSTNSTSITDKNNRYISEVTGRHARGKNNEMVGAFISNGTIFHYLPIGLKSFFHNLNVLVIYKAGLREITASDLSEFGEDLLELWLYGNNLQALDDDLFHYNPNLQYLEVSENKIKFVEDGTFEALPNLIFLGFDSNPCFSGTSYGDLPQLFQGIQNNCKDSTYLVQKYNAQVQDELFAIREDLKFLAVSIFNAYQELRAMNDEQTQNLYQTFDAGKSDINNNIEKHCNADNGNGKDFIASKLQQLQVLVAFRCFPGYNGNGIDSIDWK